MLHTKTHSATSPGLVFFLIFFCLFCLFCLFRSFRLFQFLFFSFFPFPDFSSSLLLLFFFFFLYPPYSVIYSFVSFSFSISRTPSPHISKAPQPSSYPISPYQYLYPGTVRKIQLAFALDIAEAHSLELLGGFQIGRPWTPYPIRLSLGLKREIRRERQIQRPSH